MSWTTIHNPLLPAAETESGGPATVATISPMEAVKLVTLCKWNLSETQLCRTDTTNYA